MAGSPVDRRKSRKPLLGVGVACVVAAAAMLAVRHHAQEKSAPWVDQVVVVPTGADGGARRQGPVTDAATPLPTLLDEAGASRLVAQYLPALREVRSECDAELCIVSAEPNAAGAPLDDQAFSQLVQEDMPAILARTGHGLAEPIQIEELGPDQYRLRFRITRQAR